MQTVERRVKEGQTQAALLRPVSVVTEGLLRPSFHEKSIAKTDGLLRIAETGVAPETNSETSVDASKYQQDEEKLVEVKPAE